jgi:hypothetical protein
MAKNILTVGSSPVACSSSVLSWRMSSLMTDMGIAFWCFSSGSVFLNDLNSHCKINTGCPLLLMDGFWYPFSQKVTHTYCMVSLTVPAASRSWDALENLASLTAMANAPMMICLCSQEKFLRKRSFLIPIERMYSFHRRHAQSCFLCVPCSTARSGAI